MSIEAAPILINTHKAQDIEAQAWDYIIIGGGSAGCVLANRLSAKPNVSVLLLEAGGRDIHPWIHIPVGYLYTMNNPNTDWCLKTEPEPGLNGRALAYPRGKVLGGCSSINGMIYSRGQSNDYDGWRDLGNPGWGWADVVPFFKKSEDHFELAEPHHGQGGEWRVEAQRLSWPILDAVRNAAGELEIPKISDFNTGDNEGSSYFQVNQKSGLRWNTVKAFLHPARNRPNLTVVTNAFVQSLNISDRRATSVNILLNNQRLTLQATSEIILAAGAVGSPQILNLSGIGDPAELKSCGIKVQHTLPGIGKNLQDHLQIRTIFKISGARTLNDLSASLLGKAKIALEYAFKRSGPMSMAPSQLGIFAKSDPNLPTPDLEYHVQPLSLDHFGAPLHKFPAITVSVCDLRPTSRGTVSLRSADPNAPPLIKPNYLQTDRDQDKAITAIRHARRLMSANYLAPNAPTEILPGPERTTDAELLQAAGEIATTIFHPVGTAKMGVADDKMAVVDHKLRLHGIKGLRVVDASVMPNITSGNTNSPVIMIAEKAAEMILADRQNR